METRHGMRMEKWWECSLCGFEGEGIVLKGHFAKNHKNPGGATAHQSHLSNVPSPVAALDTPREEEEDTWLASPYGGTVEEPPGSQPKTPDPPEQPATFPSAENSILQFDQRESEATRSPTPQVPVTPSFNVPPVSSANFSERGARHLGSVRGGRLELSTQEGGGRNPQAVLVLGTEEEEGISRTQAQEPLGRREESFVSLRFNAQGGGGRNPQAELVLDTESEYGVSHPIPREPLGRREESFVSLWSDSFRACQSLNDLDGVINRCVSDWLTKASAKVANKALGERPSREGTLPANRRQQSRQLQRIRQTNNRRADKASRIQALFKVYPKRAVRQVLGEQSLSYTGNTEEASNFLRRTYVRPPIPQPQCLLAGRLYNSCDWSLPCQDQTDYLNRPPSKEEIQWKLRKATNTAPGADGLEYRHLRALDPTGQLLETIYASVWRFGIPTAWKRSRTIPIYKKGDPSDYSNFRPISLLSTLYKLFSGVLSTRLCAVAADLGWLSPEQKGFLPGVKGIQEHTQLLQTAVEETTFKRRTMSVVWLDLCNAFGSVPHAVLEELFKSLPIPDDLRRLLVDIYEGNLMDFVVGQESVTIAPSAGVRQGDALSSTVFNLAAEPLLRAAKSSTNTGFSLFGQTIKATAYADDIAVIAPSAVDLQSTLDHVSEVASVLGLQFNSGKCASINFVEGKPAMVNLSIGQGRIRSLGPEDQENYLGVPIGAKLRFRPATELLGHLDKLAESLLAPWQKLEVYRSHLLPSLSHSLASGRVKKDFLFKLDTECRKFLGHIAEVPNQAVTEFFYADRSVGGLGTFRLSEDADIWTLARATQLLSSNDPLVRGIFKEQLCECVRRGFREGAPDRLPISEFLSGSNESGLYRLRYAGSTKETLWSLARHAAKRLGVRIDISGDETILLIADDVSVRPMKAVRGLRQVVRKRNTERFTDVERHPHQGRVASALALGPLSKDMSRLISCRTELRFEDWKYLHQARLDILPLRGYSWSNCQDKLCRCCGQAAENGFHVINNCQGHLKRYTERHDSILELLHKLLLKEGHAVTINRAIPGQRLRPDVEMSLNGSRLMADVVVAYDNPVNLDTAYNRKEEKYRELGRILPLVVGSLGSWLPSNDNIRSLLGISGRSWSVFRRKARLMAIKGSMLVIRSHLKGYRQEEGDAQQAENSILL